MTKTDKFKKTMSSIGNGTLTALEAINNAPIRSRMNEIDAEIEKLQEERAELEERLIGRDR
jgi:hypothetical protein